MSTQNTEKVVYSQGDVDSSHGIYPVYKERGETLAAVLERFRLEHNLAKDDKLTYAGRLDPLAEGLVIVLAGDDRFKKDAMLGLSKAYTIEVLLGIATDTLDPLGLITKFDFKQIAPQKILAIIVEMKDITTLPYPLYSSVPVQGKALFTYARAGRAVEIPQKKVTIFEAESISIEKKLLSDIVAESIKVVTKVQGDFRQTETITNWIEFLTQNKDREVQIVKIKVRASSGTYMRSLAEWLGDKVGLPAIAYKIKRTEIGEYKIED